MHLSAGATSWLLLTLAGCAGAGAIHAARSANGSDAVDQERACLRVGAGDAALGACALAIEELQRRHETERLLVVLDHACGAGLAAACGPAALAWLPHDEADHSFARSEDCLARACRLDPGTCAGSWSEYRQRRCAHADQESCHAVAVSLRQSDPAEGATQLRRNCELGYAPSCEAIGVRPPLPPPEAGGGGGQGLPIELRPAPAKRKSPAKRSGA